MANKVIGDYSAAGSIDGSTHHLLIQPGNSSTAYNKINRNVFLGVTGQPMDTSTAQNVTNKTLDNSNILTIRDDRFTLQDNSDATKQAKFELSGITTATTRTYTLPNASSTLADTSTIQTFTNKTLTSPAITNGSITGTTITTDAIIGQSAATNGTVYGLSISSGKVGTNGVITASITDSAVTGAKIGSYKALRQDDTTNSTETSARVLTGWGVITPGVANSGSETITFVSAFSSRPIIVITSGGDNAAATTYGSGAINVKDAVIFTAGSITTTNFVASFKVRDASNYAAGNTVFYQWMAIGS
jgi:hypothetical protein